MYRADCFFFLHTEGIFSERDDVQKVIEETATLFRALFNEGETKGIESKGFERV